MSASNTASDGRPAAVVDWLLTEGRGAAGIADLLRRAGPRLAAAGLPLSHIVLGVFQLHPDLFSVNYVWDRTAGEVRRLPRPHGMEKSALFRDSPALQIVQGAPMVRHRPAAGGGAAAPAFIEDLGLAGASDIVAWPLVFGDGGRHVIGFATERPGGFDEAELDRMSALLPALASVIELKHLGATSAALLDLYVGHDAGERIMRGQVKRGDGETIGAVIWFCDLVGFTAMSQVLPRDEVIALLNRFFDAMAEPVEAEGGTVLKFMGDGMLAIFPLPADRRRHGALCRRALGAARRACANVDRINTARAGAGEAALEFGAALHLGDVMYGNVGAARRLDFTVIGPAVNLTARLEALSHRLGRRVLTSAAFAELAGGGLQPLGRYRLKNVRGRQQVYAMA